MALSRWAAWFVVLVFAIGLSCASDGGGDDDDDAGNSDNGSDGNGDDDNTMEETWTDSDSGLTWQRNDDCCLDWESAKNYCASLVWNEHGDWRLPSISELRSLIRGCVATELDGACEVTDECRFAKCWDLPCQGCKSGEGPDADGIYWPDGMSGLLSEVGAFWSSTKIATFYESGVWGVIFDDASIYLAPSDGNNIHTICVR
ncbi:DUF1566 domain-containing protein [bacterium]|nr:DUF1566 domain-containing protein [bacterium]